jgi:hypothetical protein
VKRKYIEFYFHVLAVGSFTSLIPFQVWFSYLKPIPFTSLRLFHFTHLSTPQHKWFIHSMPQNPRSHSISFNGCLPTHVVNLANFARFATFHPQKQPVKLHCIPQRLVSFRSLTTYALFQR